MGIFKKPFLVLFLLITLPAVSHAQVSKIVFTTEPQTVKLREISGTITVQLQDSAGNAYKSTETVDVKFLSSSASGKFLSPSSENVATKTISTGSANKNFRYRDSTEGVFTMTVKATGRTSGNTWSASQVITVAKANDTDVAVKMGEQILDQIASIRTQISGLQQKLAVVAGQEEKQKIAAVGDNEEKDVEKLQLESQTALVVDAMSESKAKPSGIRSWFEILKRFFLRTR